MLMLCVYINLIITHTCMGHHALIPSPLSGYVEGTFTLLWQKEKEPGLAEEEELFDKSTATLHESGMEGGKEYLVLRDKDGRCPERVEVRGVRVSLKLSVIIQTSGTAGRPPGTSRL